jgi:hypothetical protein
VLQTSALKFGAAREKIFRPSQARGQTFEHLTVGSLEDRELVKVESKTLLSLQTLAFKFGALRVFFSQFSKDPRFRFPNFGTKLWSDERIFSYLCLNFVILNAKVWKSKRFSSLYAPKAM